MGRESPCALKSERLGTGFCGCWRGGLDWAALGRDEQGTRASRSAHCACCPCAWQSYPSAGRRCLRRGEALEGRAEKAEPVGEERLVARFPRPSRYTSSGRASIQVEAEPAYKQYEKLDRGPRPGRHIADALISTAAPPGRSPSSAAGRREVGGRRRFGEDAARVGRVAGSLGSRGGKR